MPERTVAAVLGLCAWAALTACGAGGGSTPHSAASSPGSAQLSKLDWPTFGFSTTRSGENPSETSLTPSTVGQLHLLWSTKIGAGAMYADTQPIVASNVSLNGTSIDVVYAGDEHGYLIAANAATGAVLWSKHLPSQTTACNDIPDSTYGITSTPAIDRSTNRLYVVGGTGLLMAFDLATGNVASGWPTNGVLVVDDPTLDHVWSGLTFDATENLLFVPTASYCDLGVWHGAARAIGTGTGTVANVFYFGTASSTPPNALPSYGGGIWSWGGVSIDATTHNLYGATGNLEPFQNTTYSDSLVVLSPALAPLAASLPIPVGGDDDFGGTAVIYDDASSSCVAAMRKDGTLFVFDRTNVNGGPTLSLAMGSGGHAIATPAHSSATHFLYVANPANGAFTKGLYAFAVSAGCTLNPTPVWSQAVAPFVAPTTVAGGVVYQPSGTQIQAFNAANGAPLWNSGTAVAGTIQNGVTVVNGRVYAVDWNDTLYAFSL